MVVRIFISCSPSDSESLPRRNQPADEPTRQLGGGLLQRSPPPRHQPSQRELVEGPEDGALHGLRRDRRIEFPRLLPFAHDLAEDVQIRGDLLPAFGLEELRALPQLHDQDLRERRVLLHQREVELDEACEAGCGRPLLHGGRLRLAEKLAHLLVEEAEEDVVLVLKKKEDGPAATPAARAISATVAPKNPRSANTLTAASRMRARLSFSLVFACTWPTRVGGGP